MFSLPLSLSAPNSRPMQGRETTRGEPSVTPTAHSAGAWGRGHYNAHAMHPRRETAGLEKGGRRRETPLPVRLHLLHVAHKAPTTAPRVEEQNASHRDRGFTPTPLRWISSSCDVQINPAPMQTFPPPPFFPNSAPVQLRSNRRE